MNFSESENLEQQANGQSETFERADNSLRQNQVIEKKIDDQKTIVIGSAVTTVEHRKHGAILTAIDNVLIPRVEMAVKLITGSADQETNGEVQNLDLGDISGNI